MMKNRVVYLLSVCLICEVLFTGCPGTGSEDGAAPGVNPPTAVAGTGGSSVAGQGGMTAGTGGMTAGTGGMTASTGGMTAGAGGEDAGTGGTGGMPGEDLGMGDGKDVVTVGDSLMRNLVQIPGFMPEGGIEIGLANATGMRPFRNYGSGGDPATNTAAAMLNNTIPMQYAKAKSEGAITTVIGVGGGNDAVEGNNACAGATTMEARSAACVDICNQVNAKVDEMIATMAADGVKDLIWINYPTPLMTQKGDFTGFIDSLRADRETKCVTDNPALGLRCHLIDSVPFISGTLDGVHPDAASNDVIGDEIWKTMQEQGIRR